MSRKRVLTLDKDSESIDSTKYRGMIGSLLYLIASRPDIVFSVFLYARFYEDPKVSHLEAVKRIFGKTKGTQHLGLRYPKDTGANVLVYANSDHADDVADRKSISRICTYVGSCLTSWFSKKQASHANSITESDYVAARRACQQSLWMKQAFVDYNIMLNEVLILCDDKCAINLTSSPIDYPRTKHIKIRHHFLKDNVAKKHITIDKILLGENVANILAKPLENDQFSYLRLGLGLMLQEEEEEEEEKKGQDVIEEYEGDERIMFKFILKGFAKSEIWDNVKEPLSLKLNEDEFSICCENTTHIMNTLKEARIESREMLLSIHHSIKMLLDIISKMNRKLEDKKVKRNNKALE
ncbi:hypothetical protein Tco_1406118 [Tanacetum coccineum]